MSDIGDSRDARDQLDAEDSPSTTDGVQPAAGSALIAGLRARWSTAWSADRPGSADFSTMPRRYRRMRLATLLCAGTFTLLAALSWAHWH
jgi:hypothetical protein